MTTRPIDETWLHEPVTQAATEEHPMTRPKSLLSTSPAARLEQLLDLYSPMVEREDGTIERDPAHGFISKADFLKLLEIPDEEP